MYEPLAAILLGFILITMSSRGALKSLVKLSRHFGMGEFLISFVVLGVASIAPELFIGVIAALEGASPLGFGVAIGSNVADLSLIIGLVALAGSGIPLRKPTIKQTRGLLLTTALPVLLILGGTLSRIDGALLVLAFIGYLAHLFKQRATRNTNFIDDGINVYTEGIILITCITGLLFSAELISQAAQEMSSLLGAPLVFIGTLIAAGTCLPELTFSIHAVHRHHPDLGFGDIIGNVIADCLFTTGIIALIQPIQPAKLFFALFAGGAMLFNALILFFYLGKHKGITRNAGILLVSVYILFLIAQVLVENALI